MSLDKYRNEICKCGSGKKFKYCCLLSHYKEQTALVQQQAKDKDEKEARRLNRQYDRQQLITFLRGLKQFAINEPPLSFVYEMLPGIEGLWKKTDE